MAQNTASEKAPDVAHKIAELLYGEIIGYDAERDSYGIKYDGKLGSVATDSALEAGYVVSSHNHHPSDEWEYQVVFQNIAQK